MAAQVHREDLEVGLQLLRQRSVDAAAVGIAVDDEDRGAI